MRRLSCAVCGLLAFGAISASAVAQPDDAEVVIGAVLPMSGAWRSSGIESEAALAIAVEHINAYLDAFGLSLSAKGYKYCPR